MKRRRLLMSVLFVLLITLGIGHTTVFAVEADSVIVHYHRYDNDYSDWSLWVWEGQSSGFDVAFTGSDTYGVTANIDVTDSYFDTATSIGVLIKDSAWNKDVEADRFINLSGADGNGDIHVYFLQGESFFSYVSSNQVGCNPESPDPYLCAQELQSGLLDVYFNSSLNVHFISTDIVTAADITITKDGVPVGFTGFVSGTSGTLVLSQTVALGSIYKIQVNYNGTIIERVIRVNMDYDSSGFAQAYHYDGMLGVEYSSTSTTFRLWAPVSSSVEVNLYTKGHTVLSRNDGVDVPYDTILMDYVGKGVWATTVSGDLNGVYYTYNVVNSGSKVEDIQDPYGVTFGLNGQRSMVVDLDSTDPLGWENDQGVDGYTNPNEAIIYELHVRDLTSQNAWGGPSEYQGKYMGFTVENTSYTNTITGVTVSTGLAHLIELGITHVHLLPTYDQDWNNEANFQFNWGYNPQNYNSPEGGYSTDPYDGAVRINEYKQMVMALHSNGINVINDVVYNHTGPGGYYSFNRIVPNYFYRLNPDGSYSNGTGVGNETASERYMVNKFIVDSVVYWAEEFHIDGFRFDLMAVHDYHTMNDVANAVEAIDADIFVYGEPWGGGTIALDWNLQAGKHNLDNMPLIAAFNDQIRNAIKGSPDGNDAGYVTNGQNIYDVMKGIEGSINWGMGNTSSQSVNYVTAHDNLTLYDKLLKANGVSGYTEEVDYQARLANSIVLFSQGIPFLHSGVEFLRTKGGNSNSYDASDLVNQLNWVRKSNNVESFEYYKGIIEIRKAYESFKMSSRTDIETYLDFLNPSGFGMIGYRLTKNNEDILVYHNAGAYSNDITLPSGAWKLLSDRNEAGLSGLGTYASRYPIEQAETLVFVRGNSEDVIPSPTHIPEITNIISIAYEGATVRINSTTAIAAYSIDGGDYITVSIPSTFVDITGLAVGFHTIRVKDQFGGISDPFDLTILARNDVVTCEDGYHEVDGECVPDEVVCDEGYELVGEECQLIPPTQCDDGYELIGEECLPVEYKKTGCFSIIGSGSGVTALFTIIALSGVVFLRIRKK